MVDVGLRLAPRERSKMGYEDCPAARALVRVRQHSREHRARLAVRQPGDLGSEQFGTRRRTVRRTGERADRVSVLVAREGRPDRAMDHGPGKQRAPGGGCPGLEDGCPVRGIVSAGEDVEIVHVERGRSHGTVAEPPPNR